jgi:outer membrane protein, heavy metal efflux system
MPNLQVMTVLVVTSLAASPAARAAEVASSPARSQEPDPVLAALLAEARERNPDIQAAASALAAARQRPVQARALADPRLGVVFTNEGWSPSLGSMPDSALGVMVTQDLPFPGKRRLRGRLAELDAVEVEQRLERTRLGVAAAVRRAYYDLLAARALREITREQGVLWEQMEGVARVRYGVGQGNQQDVLRTQVEITRVQQFAVRQESEATSRLAALNGLLARPPESALETDPAALRPPDAAPFLEPTLASLRESSPELRAARSAETRSKVAIELAQREFKPDFGLQAAYMNRGGFDPMWQAGVSIALPLARGRRRAALAEAEAGASGTEATLRAIDLQLRFRTQERLAQLDAARRIATLYSEGVIPQDRMSVEAAIANYQAGRVPFVTVLEAVATLCDDRAAHVRVLASGQAALAALEEASLEPTSDLPAMGAAGAGASMSSSAAPEKPAAMSGTGR